MHKYIHKLKDLFIKIIFLFIRSLRPLLGPRGTCIYPVTCTNYSKYMLKSKPFYISIPLIILRVLSCNPLTVLYWKIKNKIKKRV
ncbi:membrane protein insertion efficiency factor YidD [Candidatus Dependentiae bacterium]|nr:membrane protein insertion efficiency factor YidD [Candidatus Dependentiae bacterium]MBU4387003.1 membrane protein insertion efficiency factor YidD [Candidatus Dependentiae bacterium]